MSKSQHSEFQPAGNTLLVTQDTFLYSPSPSPHTAAAKQFPTSYPKEDEFYLTHSQVIFGVESFSEP